MTTQTIESPHISFRRIFKTWWPLAGSWLMMSLEGPLMSAIVARLVNPSINLAAYGGIVLPIALLIESPIIMLLSASVAMSKDWSSYLKLRRFMMTISAVLTVLHALVAFTPLYDVIVSGIIGAPAELLSPGRIGLQIMLPWTWAIAFRRFNQGVMIRFGYSGGVMMCTVVRLSTITTLLFSGYFIGTIPGVVVATIAQASGVTMEGLYSGLRVRPILKREMNRDAHTEPFSWREFAAFYTPLVFTSLLQFLGQPIGSAALSRMPNAVDSLAVWGVLSSFSFLLRSFGMAYNEVVLALLDQARSFFNLRKFARILAGVLSVFILVLTATPLAMLWFEKVTGLSHELTQMAGQALWFFLLLPGLTVFQSWFQGSILFSRKTRAITESVAIFMVTLVAVMFSGVLLGTITGLFVAAAAFALANLTQTGWLMLRSRKVRDHVQQRDAA
jgi:hypothetical protein